MALLLVPPSVAPRQRQVGGLIPVLKEGAEHVESQVGLGPVGQDGQAIRLRRHVASLPEHHGGVGVLRHLLGWSQHPRAVLCPRQPASINNPRFLAWAATAEPILTKVTRGRVTLNRETRSRTHH